jgi:hypothetical protein
MSDPIAVPCLRRTARRCRRHVGCHVLLLVALTTASPALAQDFWAHWGDGRAEMNAYRLTQPRYGSPRDGTAVLVFVTEEFREKERVKAESGRQRQGETFPVLKLNSIRDFQTGIYDYNVMTSVFARVVPGWPVAKASFSSQEWCGHVYHQLLPRAGRVEGVLHSYFDGEADGRDALPLPDDGLFEDALPIALRGWLAAYLPPGQRRVVPLLPSLLRSRLEHRRLRWGRATVSRAALDEVVTVPAGRFTIVRWTVAEDNGPTTTYLIESVAPFRLIRWSVDTGEDAVLLRSTRLAYWKMNRPGDERHLEAMGLPVPPRSRRQPREGRPAGGRP